MGLDHYRFEDPPRALRRPVVDVDRLFLEIKCSRGEVREAEVRRRTALKILGVGIHDQLIVYHRHRSTLPSGKHHTDKVTITFIPT